MILLVFSPSQRMWDNIRTPSAVPLSDHYGVRVVLKDFTPCDSADLFLCSYRGGRTKFGPRDFPQSHLSNICSAFVRD